MTKPKRIIILTAGVVLVLAFFPFQQTVAPEWSVTTLDASRQPMSASPCAKFGSNTVGRLPQTTTIGSPHQAPSSVSPRTYRSNLRTRFVSCSANRRSRSPRKLRLKILLSCIRKGCGHDGLGRPEPRGRKLVLLATLNVGSEALAQVSQTDGMRRPVSGRDAVRSQVIDVLKAQIKRRPAMKKVSTRSQRPTGIFRSRN